MNDPYNYRNALPTPPPMSGDTGHRFLQATTMSNQLCSCHGIPQWHCQQLAWNSTQNTRTSVGYSQQGASSNPAYDMASGQFTSQVPTAQQLQHSYHRQRSFPNFHFDMQQRVVSGQMQGHHSQYAPPIFQQGYHHHVQHQVDSSRKGVGNLHPVSVHHSPGNLRLPDARMETSFGEKQRAQFNQWPPMTQAACASASTAVTDQRPTPQAAITPPSHMADPNCHKAGRQTASLMTQQVTQPQPSPAQTCRPITPLAETSPLAPQKPLKTPPVATSKKVEPSSFTKNLRACLDNVIVSGKKKTESSKESTEPYGQATTAKAVVPTKAATPVSQPSRNAQESSKESTEPNGQTTTAKAAVPTKAATPVSQPSRNAQETSSQGSRPISFTMKILDPNFDQGSHGPVARTADLKTENADKPSDASVRQRVRLTLTAVGEWTTVITTDVEKVDLNMIVVKFSDRRQEYHSILLAPRCLEGYSRNGVQCACPEIDRPAVSDKFPATAKFFRWKLANQSLLTYVDVRMVKNPKEIEDLLRKDGELGLLIDAKTFIQLSDVYIPTFAGDTKIPDDVVKFALGVKKDLIYQKSAVVLFDTSPVKYLCIQTQKNVLFHKVSPPRGGRSDLERLFERTPVFGDNLGDSVVFSYQQLMRVKFTSKAQYVYHFPKMDKKGGYQDLQSLMRNNRSFVIPRGGPWTKFWKTVTRKSIEIDPVKKMLKKITAVTTVECLITKKDKAPEKRRLYVFQLRLPGGDSGAEAEETVLDQNGSSEVTLRRTTDLFFEDEGADTKWFYANSTALTPDSNTVCLKLEANGKVSVSYHSEADCQSPRQVASLVSVLNKRIDYSECRRQACGGQESLKAYVQARGLEPKSANIKELVESSAGANTFVPFDVPHKRVSVAAHQSPTHSNCLSYNRPPAGSTTGTGVGQLPAAFDPRVPPPAFTPVTKPPPGPLPSTNYSRPPESSHPAPTTAPPPRRSIDDGAAIMSNIYRSQSVDESNSVEATRRVEGQKDQKKSVDQSTSAEAKRRVEEKKAKKSEGNLVQKKRNFDVNYLKKKSTKNLVSKIAPSFNPRDCAARPTKPTTLRSTSVHELKQGGSMTLSGSRGGQQPSARQHPSKDMEKEEGELDASSEQEPKKNPSTTSNAPKKAGRKKWKKITDAQWKKVHEFVVAHPSPTKNQRSTLAKELKLSHHRIKKFIFAAKKSIKHQVEGPNENAEREEGEIDSSTEEEKSKEESSSSSSSPLRAVRIRPWAKSTDEEKNTVNEFVAANPSPDKDQVSALARELQLTPGTVKKAISEAKESNKPQADRQDETLAGTLEADDQSKVGTPMIGVVDEVLQEEEPARSSVSISSPAAAPAAKQPLITAMNDHATTSTNDDGVPEAMESNKPLEDHQDETLARTVEADDQSKVGTSMIGVVGHQEEEEPMRSSAPISSPAEAPTAKLPPAVATEPATFTTDPRDHATTSTNDDDGVPIAAGGIDSEAVTVTPPLLMGDPAGKEDGTAVPSTCVNKDDMDIVVADVRSMSVDNGSLEQPNDDKPRMGTITGEYGVLSDSSDDDDEVLELPPTNTSAETTVKDNEEQSITPAANDVEQSPTPAANDPKPLKEPIKEVAVYPLTSTPVDSPARPSNEDNNPVSCVRLKLKRSEGSWSCESDENSSHLSKKSRKVEDQPRRRTRQKRHLSCGPSKDEPATKRRTRVEQRLFDFFGLKECQVILEDIKRGSESKEAWSMAVAASIKKKSRKAKKQNLSKFVTSTDSPNNLSLDQDHDGRSTCNIATTITKQHLSKFVTSTDSPRNLSMDHDDQPTSNNAMCTLCPGNFPIKAELDTHHDKVHTSALKISQVVSLASTVEPAEPRLANIIQPREMKSSTKTSLEIFAVKDGQVKNITKTSNQKLEITTVLVTEPPAEWWKEETKVEDERGTGMFFVCFRHKQILVDTHEAFKHMNEDPNCFGELQHCQSLFEAKKVLGAGKKPQETISFCWSHNNIFTDRKQTFNHMNNDPNCYGEIEYCHSIEEAKKLLAAGRKKFSKSS